MQPEPITIADILAELWAARGRILLGAAFGTFLAIVLIVAAIPATRVHMLIASARTLNDNSGAMSGGHNFAVLRFLAQRAGVDDSPAFVRFENVYKGLEVAKALYKNKEILNIIRSDQRFKITPTRAILSPEALSDYIARRVQLNPVGASSIRELSYSHPDPEAAKTFLAAIHQAADTRIRANVRNAATQRIAYLNQKLETTRNQIHRQSLTDLLLEQERALMLTAIDQPYAASIIEPPAAHYKPTWPSRTLVLFAGVLLGALFGFILHKGKGKARG